MGEFVVLLEVKLADRHRPTGRTRHHRDGALLPPPAALRIAQYPDDPGFYLLYLDAGGEQQTDTWHESLEAAQRQAEFEFGVTSGDWARPS